jgi:hypothetical protein
VKQVRGNADCGGGVGRNKRGGELLSCVRGEAGQGQCAHSRGDCIGIRYMCTAKQARDKARGLCDDNNVASGAPRAASEQFVMLRRDRFVF